MNLENPWLSIRDIAIHCGLSMPEWLTSAAEMLAASQLLYFGDECLIGRTTELTNAGWAKARDRAEQIWRERGEPGEPNANRTSPFAQALNTARWPAGYLENLREAVLWASGSHKLLDSQNGRLEAAISLLEAARDRRGPEWLPIPVARLVAEIVGKPKPEDAYCAFEGSAVAALVLGCRGTKVVLEIPNDEAAALWSALAVASGADVHVRCASPFDRLTDGGHFDRQEVAIVVPPFGAKIAHRSAPQHMPLPSSSEAWGVVLANAMASRRAACLVSSSFLFRSSMADQSFRQRTIVQYGLELVGSLPERSGINDGNLATSVLVLNTEKPGREVLMVNLTSRIRSGLTDEERGHALTLWRSEAAGWSRTVSLSEVSANDFNLQPERYVLSAEAARLETLLSSAETISLGDLVEIYRPQPTPSARKMEPDAPEADYASVKELVVSDLSDLGLASSPSKHLQVSQAQLHGLRRAELHPGDIVLVTKGSVGKVGLILQIPGGETWVANQSFAILRLRRSGPFQTPTVLFRYLNSRMGQGLLQGLKVGTAVSTLQMADLKRLPVVIPDEGTQALVVEQMDRLLELQSEIDTLRAEQAGMQAQIWPENLAGQSA